MDSSWFASGSSLPANGYTHMLTGISPNMSQMTAAEAEAKRRKVQVCTKLLTSLTLACL